MNDITKTEQLEALVLMLRQQRVLLDRDIATLYGVETRDVNKAVANNPDKFPAGYLFELTKEEKTELVENFHRFEKLKHATANQPSQGDFSMPWSRRNVDACGLERS